MKVTNTLVDKFRKGNIKTHQYYYREWYPALYKDALAAIGGNAMEAAAIVNDVFTRLWMRCEYFDTHHNISAFLHIHVRNGCHDFINRMRRPSKMQRDLQKQIIGEQAAELRDGFTRDRLLHIIESEDVKIIRQARELFRIMYARRISLEMSAEVLNLPIQKAREQLRLAMQILHLILWQG